MQGLGAAVLALATLTVLTTTFPEGAQRTRALAAWTAVGMAGGTAGNLLSGVLTEYLSWRSILFINVPIGAADSCCALAKAARQVACHVTGSTAPRPSAPVAGPSSDPSAAPGHDTPRNHVDYGGIRSGLRRG
ncbi:MFS transporter [Saccharopolyspora elongata]|uniref:MFS transporter n=1 Tax=Saccharopolyspora elongata TaxID=2530387 RepID=UPI0038B46904